jgi:hypothetical protein
MPLLPPKELKPPSARTETARAAGSKTAILLHMQINPAEDWHSLRENYAAMLDGELEQLAENIGDLTETAQQVLHNEMRDRGLGEPGAKQPSRGSEAPVGARWVSSVDPDARLADADKGDAEDGPSEFTWKTHLCECESEEQALQLRETLKRAGIDSWAEAPYPNSIELLGPRVVVAADQLEQAIEIARQPIPQDIIEQSRVEVPEYEPPKCPKCGAEDPVLENADPTNSWLCEACGSEWTEPISDGEEESSQNSR